jgi:hypothetical protein
LLSGAQASIPGSPLSLLASISTIVSGETRAASLASVICLCATTIASFRSYPVASLR